MVIIEKKMKINYPCTHIKFLIAEPMVCAVARPLMLLLLRHDAPCFALHSVALREINLHHDNQSKIIIIIIIIIKSSDIVSVLCPSHAVHINEHFVWIPHTFTIYRQNTPIPYFARARALLCAQHMYISNWILQRHTHTHTILMEKNIHIQFASIILSLALIK